MIGQFFLCPMGSYQVSGYLGLEFQIKGQTHYGWALVSIAAVFNGRTGSMETKLSGFAYETIPGAAIKTGQTSGADEDSAVGPEPISRDDFSPYSVSGNFFYTRLLIDSNERAVAPLFESTSTLPHSFGEDSVPEPPSLSSMHSRRTC